jgi:hypothetical protein
MDETTAESKRRSSRKRRLLMIGVGVGLGIICRLVPPEYQGPCGVVTKIVVVIMGGA